MGFRQNKGITLVALVITVIVLIILAGVTIASIVGDDGIIEKAKEAKTNMTNATGEEDKILQEMLNKMNEVSEEMEGSGEPEVPPTINDVVTADKIKQQPDLFYGQTVTGYECAKSEYEWQIYYADGNNIYITTKDYIKTADCPNGKGGNAIYSNGPYQPSLDNVIKDYPNGSAEITNTNITPWLSYLTSSYGSGNTNPNMKATAYLLDTNIWTNFKGSKADYAIGAPTLDMFLASYKDTHPSRYIELQSAQYGYQVKWSDGSFANSISGLTPDEFNKLYIISDTSKAFAQWFACPSARYGNYMMLLRYDGIMDYFPYDDYGHTGLRPLVRLSSEVELEKVGSGTNVSYNIR